MQTEPQRLLACKLVVEKHPVGRLLHGKLDGNALTELQGRLYACRCGLGHLDTKHEQLMSGDGHLDGVCVRLAQLQTPRYNLPIHGGRHQYRIIQTVQEVDQAKFAQGNERTGIGDRLHASSSSTICSDQRG